MFTLNNLIKQFKFIFNIRGVETDELPAPTGWRDMVVEYSRSKTYSGLIRNITGQLDFAGNAAYLLRREYAKYRLMTRMNLQILEDTREPYNTFTEIYNGRLDFSKKVDKQGTFTVGAKSNDFSVNIDAYDSQNYAIPVTDGINLELPGIALDEIASLIPGQPTDGNRHSDYFPPIQVVNNTQNSISASVQSVNYGQFRGPDFSSSLNWFYNCQLTGKLLITGSLNITIFNGGSTHHLQLSIFNQHGTILFSFYDAIPTSEFSMNANVNISLDVTYGDKLFLYMRQIDSETSNTGIQINSGQIDLSYKTITPPTMTQALSGTQLFAKLLQAMNVNQDSGPNLPVPFQSFLLSGALDALYFTCSDSIRAANGSVFHAGNTLGPGIYKVIVGSVTYAAITYTLNQQFTFAETSPTFTGTGVIQKVQSIFIGNVYNIGDSLQAGGTYLVGGDTSLGGHVTYNSHAYPIGSFFKFVLGFDTFAGSDDSIFVKQVAIDPQIITSFATFFQCIKSIQGGDCAFGVENGIPFLETLANVFRAGIGTADLGVVPKDWQSECASDSLYNTIKVGQKTQQYDSINANQEVSAEQDWSSAQLSPVSPLNLLSEIRFDPYGIEIVRITQNDTSASRSDNDTWGIWINTTAVSLSGFTYYKPLGPEGLSVPILGVPQGYYNYNLSPKHCMNRGSRYFASIFYKMTGYQLRLTGYTKNIGMICVGLDGVRVAESDPIDIATLGKPYFIPEVYSFTIPSGLVDTNSYADIKFKVNGTVMKGFISDYKCNFATDKPTVIKLLLSPDNDLGTAVR